MIITWQSSGGVEVEFSKDSETYKLLKNYDGFSTAYIEHQTTVAPYQNGSTYLDTRFTDRQIQFDVLVTAPTLTDVQAAVQYLSRLLNPIGGPGILMFEYEDGTTYYINAIGNNTPRVNPGVRGTNYQLVTINLVAHDPFWYSDSQAVTIGSSTTATFPLVFPFTLPANTATVVATNSGDIEAPVTIIITGDVTNPVLTNVTTGKAITFAKDMDANDTMTITTGFGNKTVSYYDYSGGTTVNGFQYLSPASEFWGLIPGDNTLTFTATSIDAATRATCTWQNRYSGV